MRKEYAEILSRLIGKLKSVLKEHPDYADMQNRLGLALCLLKEHKAAYKHFEKALEINGNYTDCVVNLAYLMHHMSRTEDAIGMLKKFRDREIPARIAHTRPYVAHTLGRLLALTDNLEEAAEFINEASETKRPLLFRLDAELLRLLLGESVSYVERRIRHFASIDAPYKRYISIHRLLLRTPTLKRRILRLFATNPNLHLVYVDMADMVASEGDLQTARRLFRKAETILPDSAFIEDALGTICIAQGDPEKARRHFRRAIRYDPKFVKAYLNLAYICSDRGDLNHAIRHIQRAVKVAPLYPDLRWHLGTHLLLAGRYEEAKEQLEKALSLLPPYNVAKYALATALFHLNEYERVLQIYEELDIDGLEIPEMHAQRVACYLALERPVDAIKECIYILPLEIRPAFMLYFAHALAHIDQREQARRLLERVLESSPDDVVARRARTMLRRLRKDKPLR